MWQGFFFAANVKFLLGGPNMLFSRLLFFPLLSSHPSCHGPMAYSSWYLNCPWGLYAPPPPVAMAVVGWFLFFSFLGGGKCTQLTPKTKFLLLISIRDLHQKKKTKNIAYACFSM